MAGLFDPLDLRGRRLRNRILAVPHGQNALTPDELARNFDELARRSAAMLILGGSSVERSSWRQTHFALFDRRETQSLAPAVAAAQGHGSLVISQLLHVGAQLVPSETFESVWSPSPVQADGLGAVTRGYDKADLATLRAAFRTAGRNMRDAGVDGLELHAAHGYLLNQFLSKKWNQRSDEYGGGLDGRGRIVHEILQELRADHPDAVLGIRLPFSDAEPDGLAVEEAITLSDRYHREGLIDYVTVTVAARPNRYVRDESFAAGGMRAASAQAKAALGCIVIVSQRLGSAAQAEAIIAAGDADMVGLGRPLLADPAWGEKAAAGRADEIRPCIHCLEDCRIYRPQYWVSCAVNPKALARERRPAPETLAARRVAIVGGGPAGCEAAMAVARAGGSAVLFETAERLGGRTRLAGAAPQRATWRDYADYLDRMVRRTAGVELRLGRAATTAAILAEKPELILVATGAAMSPAAGIADAPAILTDDVLAGRTPVDWRHVLVIDETGHWDAINAAELLLDAGRRVTFVSRAERLGPRLQDELREYLLPRLYRSGLAVVLQSTVEGGETVHRWTGERQPIERADGVVWARAMRATELLPGLAGCGVPFRRLGDCLVPRGLSLACQDGVATETLVRVPA